MFVDVEQPGNETLCRYRGVGRRRLDRVVPPRNTACEKCILRTEFDPWNLTDQYNPDNHWSTELLPDRLRDTVAAATASGGGDT
ncbi:hypothetical protein [Nocardia farcinica]|uniref:hypothetical protein n=1 Tax=Nocardia farcinica TaxID=37329 RepID=UPI001894C2E3|nr:hypothetical protein [Nocardia farcinica]MBF6419985.1 hypothetical protein [Nocardia farcinica]MBF6431462.1 hypothetical protein [Nocardia farcinica]MBF6503559.1 hypothetical protein [Nocardia farcinica]MBF6540244.1 hypothetical protein [Nocardia farcinica]